MKSDFHNQAISLFCGLFVFSSLFIGILAFYKNDVMNEKKDIFMRNDIVVKSYRLNNISIIDRLSLSDKVGRSIIDNGEIPGVQNVFDFDVTSNYDEDVYYEIYVTKELVENEIDSRFVKLYLVDKVTGTPMNLVDGIVPTYYDLKVADSDPVGRRLYYGIIKANEVKKFELKMWLAEDYSYTDIDNEFIVNVKVKVN